MNQLTLAAVAVMFSLLVVGGCASNDAAFSKDPAAATVKSDKVNPAAGEPKKTKNITNAIIAIVNDEIITLHDVNKEAQSVISDAEKKSALDESSKNKIRRTILDRLIEKKLIEQKIKELNIRVSEEEIRQAIDDVRKQNNIASQEALVTALAGQGLSFDQYRSQLQEQIEKLKLVSMEVRAKVQVGDSEIRNYYNTNIAKYTEEESYRARHIFFKTGEKATEAEINRARTTALAVLKDARSGADFVELAKKFSEDPAARKDGGDLGNFKKGDMQAEFEKAVLVMKQGDVSDLVSTPSGFHIIKLDAKVAGSTKPLEQVKADIEEILYRNKSEERFSQWAKDLRGKASVEIRELDGLL